MSATNTSTPASKGKSSGFLWFVIIAFGLMLAVWLTLFILAAENPVKEIPLNKGTTTSLNSPAAALPQDEAQRRQNEYTPHHFADSRYRA